MNGDWRGMHASVGVTVPLQPAAIRGPVTVEMVSGATIRTPRVALSPQVREHNLILPPGAAGPCGAPYKLLRTQVMQRLRQIGANVLAVLSAESGAGKTLTALNLAIAMAAERDRHVLLVDFDLRRPGLARRLGLSPTVGVEDCLLDRRPVHEAMLRIEGYERLTILPARQAVEHSGELLAEQNTADVVTEMRGRYVNRVLVIDLPPVLEADDALIFARHAQAGLMVIGEGHTRREDVTRAFDLMRDLPIVGTALNGARDAGTAGY